MDTKKLLVISDSHEHIDKLKFAFQHGKDHNIEDAVFLGDGVEDLDLACKEFNYFPKWKIVRGNHDISKTVLTVPKEEILEFGGHRFFLCHGKEYDLFNGNSKLYQAAKEAGADVALCGHYHDCKKEKIGNIWIIRPGSIGAAQMSYGIRSFIVIECPPEKDIIVERYTLRHEKIEKHII
jgi:putative phosphoesterase